MRTVFKNGHVYTMNREMPYVTAVVIEDDKIVYVGNDTGAAAYEAEADKVVDLNGKMMAPGLIDAHCHPIMSAFLTSGILCDAEMDKEDCLEAVRAYIAEHPDQDVYYGLGYPEWVFDERGPRKEDLDAVCPDKPLFLMSNGVHEGWANSKTLEVVGITKDTPDPIPGYSFFRRDEDGTPTGNVIEVAAEMIILRKLPWFKEDAVTQNYRDIFNEYSSLGVTAFMDCGAFGDLDTLGRQYISKFEKAGELQQRISGCVCAEDQGALSTAVAAIREGHAQYHSDFYNINTLKIVNDGTVESSSCAMYEPYSDGSVVEPMAQGETLYAPCVEAAKEGFNIHIHAIGNKAIHETLMAAKAVREAGHFDARMINAHTHLTCREDIPLFAKYNVCANTSSIWHYYTPDAAPIVGEEWAKHQFEMQSIIKHGARLTLGSDFPADEMGKEPLKGIQMGVTRQLYSEVDPPILEDESERLTVEQCLAGYTINAAYGMHWDDKIGSLEVGKYADLVVLEKDITAIDPHEIMNVPVLLTVMGGKITYQNENFAL